MLGCTFPFALPCTFAQLGRTSPPVFSGSRSTELKMISVHGTAWLQFRLIDARVLDVPCAYS
ncbi:hypothetical protein Syun_011098 [Stephania yunnanensis]|uniref:Uncharacterized protein n=1 Tax=Stephania yunnanensis TaxID=152371 RepID=A0AAP0PE45_9MAGN